MVDHYLLEVLPNKIAPLKVSFDGYNNSIVFNIIKTCVNPIILGLSWLKRYNPSIDWKLRKIIFPIEPLLIELPKKPQTIKSLFIVAKVVMKNYKTRYIICKLQ